ncbi:MAG: protein O-mannosyl-transferase family [Roseiflexaceae bacterium]
MTKQPADRRIPAIGDQLKKPGSPAQGEHKVRTYITRSPAHPLTRSPWRMGYAPPLALFLLFLAVYTRTAAPSVLSGDSAEFQLAAPLLGVPHPTTYPLYVLLGKLATLLLPFGDLAWRVTLVSAACAALAVALLFLLARRVTGSTGAATVAALALGVAPGLWNAATLAEVYAPLAALLAGLGYLLVSAADETRTTEPRTENREPRTGCPLGEQRTKNKEQKDETRSPAHPLTRSEWRLRAAAFVVGLGCTHHGLFLLTGLPLFVGYLLWRLAQLPTTDDRRPTTDDRRRALYGGPSVAAPPTTRFLRFTFYVLRLKPLAILALCFAAGLAPWLYPLAQYARYGPFDGQDYGLPQHYFWGAPRSWAEVFDLISGGALRRGIFRVPSADAALAVLRLVAGRMWFEFGPLGVALGLLGAVALAPRARGAWAGTAWVFLATLVYLLLLGPAVADAPVFTLPMLLPWALWIAAAVEFILRWTTDVRRPTTDDRRPTTDDRRPTTDDRRPTTADRPPTTDDRRPTADDRPPTMAEPRAAEDTTHHIPHTTRITRSPGHPVTPSPGHPVTRSPAQTLLLSLLIAATLAWGYTRIQHSSKRRLWLFREFGQATLAALPPNAVVLAHWEQGMTLQYLRLIEGQRPDVWVDVVEPADEAWGTRARRRYADRPVFFVGQPADVAGLPVELLREAEYADLFRLR